MSGLAIVAGGIVGAVVNLMWQDAYRDRRGRYRTHRGGFGNWLAQAAIGAVVGAGLTPVVVMAFVASPPVTLVVGGFICWFLYKDRVDPR